MVRAIFGPTGDEDQTIGLVRTAVTASDDSQTCYGLAKETGWCVQRGRCHAVNLKADKAAPIPSCVGSRSQVVESVTNDDRMWKLGEGGEDKVVTMLYLPN